MKNIVITHVGISALECDAIAQREPAVQGRNSPDNYNALPQLKQKRYQLDLITRNLPAWANALRIGLDVLWSDTRRHDLTARLKKSPVEIASLHVMQQQQQLRSGDRVVLVHSETTAGEFAALLLQDVLSSRLTSDTITRKRDSIPQTTLSSSNPTTPSIMDVYAPYEVGLQWLLRYIDRDHGDYNTVLVYQQRLTENILDARIHGDTQDLKNARSKIISCLQHISLSVFGISFNDLCYESYAPLQIPDIPDEYVAGTGMFVPEALDIVPPWKLVGVEAGEGGKAFLQEGLPRYMQIVSEQRRTMQSGDQLLFNITGGYKGLVPFAVLAAQLLGTHPTQSVPTKLIYLHEDSPNLLPVTALAPIDWVSLKQCCFPLAPQPPEPDQAGALEMALYYFFKDNPSLLNGIG